MSDFIQIPKLPPERMPALSEEIETAAPAIEAAVHPEVLPKFVAYRGTVKNLADVVNKNKSTGSPKSRAFDKDHDNPGYGLHNGIQAHIRSFTADAIPLDEEEQDELAKARTLRKELYDNKSPKLIFQQGYVAQWNSVQGLLTRANDPKIAPIVQELGFTKIVKRLARCHNEMGVLIGIKAPGAPPEENSIASVEEAFKKLIAAVNHFYGENTPEHQEWHERLLGPHRRHAEIYRADIRRSKKAREDDEDEEEERLGSDE